MPGNQARSRARACSNASICGACCKVLADVVQAVQQQVFAERIDVEPNLLAARTDHHLPREINGQARVAAELGVLYQLVAHRAGQAHRQDAVLEAVVVEDVGEVRRDDAADAEIKQRPGRVLARRATAEVFMRDQDLRMAIGLLVEHEIRPLGPLRVEAQRVEQVSAESAPLDRLEKARGDDLVGVDVGERQGSRRRGQGGERLHVPAPSRTAARRRDARSPPPPPPSPGTAGASARPGLDGPRSCGWTCSRSAGRG